MGGFLCEWCFFFFKQKTAYEMRISDWSSDVCSSDLTPRAEVSQLPGDAEILPNATAPETGLEQVTRRSPRADLYAEVAAVWELIRRRGQQPTPELIVREIGPDLLARFLNTFPGSRSEEHTSELQSLMRISYAVFCLKKKKKQSVNN